MTAFLLVVFDGLRPDMIEPAVTPNLVRFAAMGTRFPSARSVFPSETRVCTASVTTGCHPRRHGLVANRLAHPEKFGASVDTGDAIALRALEAELGAPLLKVPTLGERLAAAGREFAVFSSGSTGQTFVLNPRAEELGQISINAHGPEHCSPRGRELFSTLPSVPRGNPPARAAWIADAFREKLLPAPPDASVLWLCEPDTTAHYGGLNSAAQRDALKITDAAFGRILDDWERGPHHETLQIAVASDHGHTTISGHVAVAAALDGVPEFQDCVLLSGSSGGILIPGAVPEKIARAAAWLTRQDWCGAVLVARGVDPPPGVLSHEAALIDHPRAAHVLFTLRADNAMSPAGLPGTSLEDGSLAVGGGTHGGLSRAEMRTVLMLAGSAIRRGWVSDWPAGLPDIAPTALALLGLPVGLDMDGRVLVEAFSGGAEATESRSPETWEASGENYSQIIARARMGRHVWIDHGDRFAR